MEDAFLFEKKSTDITHIEDILSLKTLNEGDIFFILNDTMNPAETKIGILKNIIFDETDKNFKIATINFVTTDETTFFLRTYFRGEIDFFSSPKILGGELFEKYKMYKKINNNFRK